MFKMLRCHNVTARGNMKITRSTSETYESELVEKLRSGDSTAIEQFYNMYRNRLYSLVFEHVGRDQAAADDLVQEIFLAALGSLDRFRGESQLYTWLYSIAFHKINDFHRRQAREPKPKKSAPSIDAMELERTGDKEPATLSVMESEETSQAVQQALTELPEDYQEVLVLKYLEDLPVLEISQAMGRSPKSVEGLLSRARKALRANLEGNGENGGNES